MNDEYKKMYCGTFEVDEREKRLYERVTQYFKDTDDVDFKVSQQCSRQLKVWCENNGYSNGDLNRTKTYLQRYETHTIN